MRQQVLDFLEVLQVKHNYIELETMMEGRHLDRELARRELDLSRMQNPCIAQVKIDERDKIMAQRLWYCANELQMAGNSIVAIVGLSHMDEIIRRLVEYTRIQKEKGSLSVSDILQVN